MSTRSFIAGSGNWQDASNWSADIAPIIGDQVDIPSGTVLLSQAAEPQPGKYDGVLIYLGDPNGGAGGAAMILDEATLGLFTTVTNYVPGAAGPASLYSYGTSFIQGELFIAASPQPFTLVALQSHGNSPADIVLDNGSATDIQGTLVQEGRLDLHSNMVVESGGTLSVAGTINTASASLAVFAGGMLAGAGTIAIGAYSSLFLEAGSAPSNVSVDFAAAGARLRLADPSNYTGTVSGFSVGDFIDLTALDGTNPAAYYAYGNGSTLTVRQGGSTGAIVASLNLSGPAATGTMAVSADDTTTSPGIYITAPATQPRIDYTSAVADIAVGGNTARANLTTAKGVPINGAGVKIGIISNSFDHAPGLGAADPANADAIAGLLPLSTDGTTSAVSVLHDDEAASGTDEGRAMAELIHTIAPGAQLYFYSALQPTDTVDAIQALTAAGCNVIVNDVLDLTQPFFQSGGPIDAAVERAIAGGTSYFQAAGNFASSSFSGTFTASHGQTTLSDGSNHDAYIFADGSAYQTIAAAATTGLTAVLYLQWDAPFPIVPGMVPPQDLAIDVFDLSGKLVATSSPTSYVYDGKTYYANGAFVALPATQPTTYQIAIYNPDGEPVPGAFKIIMISEGAGAAPGGYVFGAGSETAGTVNGPGLLADVNTVGAVNFADTPAFASPASVTEGSSSTGGDDLARDNTGASLAGPLASGQPSFVAPDGAATNAIGDFLGTSAAVANAAAVAALTLQAQPNLTPAQVTHVLSQSATDLGEPAALQGAGLIQAPAAVQAALATTPLGRTAAAAGGTITMNGDNDDLTLSGMAATTVIGGGFTSSLLAGNGDLTFEAGSANVLVTAGNGHDVFTSPTTGGGDDFVGFGNGDDLIGLGSGNASVTTGSGNSTLYAPGSGNSSTGLSVGAGSNTIVAGQGAVSVTASGGRQTIYLGAQPGYLAVDTRGAATVIAGAGAATVSPDAGSSTIFALAGGPMDVAPSGTGARLTFVSGDAPATVEAGAGSDFIWGGAGGGAFHAGTGGNNSVVGTGGNTTLYGSASGDLLYAATGNETLIAGNGQETLAAAARATYELGSATATVVANGGGSIGVGAGAASVFLSGGGGNEIFVTDGQAGGTLVVLGFDTRIDQIALNGYGFGSASAAASDVITGLAGGTPYSALRLSDGTSIELYGVGALGSGNFVLT